MTAAADLTPGDLVTSAGMSAVYIEQAPHPIYPGLRLVVWSMPGGTWSLDALDPGQDVGDVDPDHAARPARLRAALLGQARP